MIHLHDVNKSDASKVVYLKISDNSYAQAKKQPTAERGHIGNINAIVVGSKSLDMVIANHEQIQRLKPNVEEV